MILILLSVLLTGFNIYPQIAKWGGAGALVPITGFANSVAAPAIEYQKEGQVMGIGCKIVYHSRSGDIIWNLLKLGTWSVVLDMEDFESGVKKFLDSGQQVYQRSQKGADKRKCKKMISYGSRNASRFL